MTPSPGTAGGKTSGFARMGKLGIKRLLYGRDNDRRRHGSGHMTAGDGVPAATETLEAIRAQALRILGITELHAELSPTAREVLQIVERLQRYTGAGHTSQPNPMREIRSR